MILTVCWGRQTRVVREYLCLNVNFKDIRHQKKAGLPTLRDDRPGCVRQ